MISIAVHVIGDAPAEHGDVDCSRRRTCASAVLPSSRLDRWVRPEFSGIQHGDLVDGDTGDASFGFEDHPSPAGHPRILGVGVAGPPGSEVAEARSYLKAAAHFGGAWPASVSAFKTSCISFGYRGIRELCFTGNL